MFGVQRNESVVCKGQFNKGIIGKLPFVKFHCKKREPQHDCCVIERCVIKGLLYIQTTQDQDSLPVKHQN